MQSAHPEISQNATSVDLSHSTDTLRQHGLPTNNQQTSDHFGSSGNVADVVTILDDGDTVSVTSSATSRGRRANDHWMNSRDGSSQERSPGSRIEAYEQANVIPRKPSHEMLFQIIPSTSKAQPRVSVVDLPNGQ